MTIIRSFIKNAIVGVICSLFCFCNLSAMNTLPKYNFHDAMVKRATDHVKKYINPNMYHVGRGTQLSDEQQAYLYHLSMAGQIRDLCFITNAERASARLDNLLSLSGFKPYFLGTHYIQNGFHTKYLLIGIEGPCLSGKSYLINILASRLKYYDYDTYVIEEYVKFAKGHANFPPMLSKSYSDSIKCGDFFVGLEQQRIDSLQCLLKKINKEKFSIIFVDRLIFSIAYYRNVVNDVVGIGIINKLIIDGKYIHPNFTLLLMLPKNITEITKRRKTRKEFPGSEFIYEPLGSNNYTDYFNNINALRASIIILQQVI